MGFPNPCLGDHRSGGKLRRLPRSVHSPSGNAADDGSNHAFLGTSKHRIRTISFVQLPTFSRQEKLPPATPHESISVELHGRYGRAVGSDSHWMAVRCTCCRLLLYVVTGFRISPPGTPTNRKVLSIRNLFIATCVAAAVSQFIDKQLFHKQLLHMSTGVSAGLIATSVAFAVFCLDWRRRWVPIAITLPGVVILDIAVGTLVGAWSGALAIRAFHNVAFVVCASVSPLVTFLVLRVYGYYSPHTSG